MAEQTAAVQPSKPTPPKATHQNPTTPFSGFMYKAVLVSVIVALLPIFPSSQAPELSSKSILARGWELLHLLLVGIAISYGLFSRRNPDPEIEKEAQQKTDTPHSYVSQILPVFDDEGTHSPKGFDLAGEPKNQTWNYSQYHREEPVVMVTDASNGANSGSKPLFLPVRSLKSQPQYPELFDSGYEIDEPSSFMPNEDGGKESVVLPSPIPWRSRSGRMEVREEPPSPPLASPTTPSPKRLSPSPSLSPEITGKINEDFRGRRSFHKSSPPPPPPPPPPPSHAPHLISERRYARRSFKDELEDLSRRGSNGAGSRSFRSEGSYTGRSVRRVRSNGGRNLPPLPRNQDEKRNKFREKMIIASDSESDDGRGDSGTSDPDEEERLSSSVSKEEEAAAAPEENEVDKKADEFIAKFREQIRLQRIESIKRTTGQRSTKNSS